MQTRQNASIQIEYGKENLKEILIGLLTEQYINYINIKEQ